MAGISQRQVKVVGVGGRKHRGGRWKFTLAAGLQLGIWGEAVCSEVGETEVVTGNQRRDKESFAKSWEDIYQGINTR